MKIDIARCVLSRIISETDIEQVRTEADVRFRLIDRILVEVLGWARSEIKMEPPTESGFIDYLLNADGRNRLVVEAKRTSVPLIDTARAGLNTYKLGGPALKSAKDGIDQATRYCIESGVSFAAVTNGTVWIGFLAVRGDGKPRAEGHAYCFSSLNDVVENFAVFYDLFSREGVLEKLYLVHSNKADGITAVATQVLYRAIPEHRIHLIERSALAVDMDRLFRGFFSVLSGAEDLEMLRHCFVETKESREADITLQKISRDLINSIQAIDTGAGEQLEQEIATAVDSNRGEAVLIIGNKGAGKSTFIDRFFELVLEPKLRARCLVLRVDIGDSPGDLTQDVNAWITERLLENIETALYRGESPDYEELLGIFFKEYQRWSEGEMRHLYETDRDQFRIEFGRFMQQEAKQDRYAHLLRLLRHAVRGRQLMPCIVFDNTDQFSQRFQEAIFQYAHSIYRAVFSFVIVPITDRTLWQLSKSGPFQSYRAKSFYLPVPSTKDILEKRVQYVRKKAAESGERKKEGSYFLSKGIRLSVEDLNAFAACLEEIFLTSEFVSRRIGWLANHDIRRSLELTNRIVTSPTIKIDDLVKAYLIGRSPRVQEFQINLALILRDYNFYNQSANDFVADLFGIGADTVVSPLLPLSVLKLLLDRANTAGDLAGHYMEIPDVISYFEPMGVPEVSVSSILRAMLSRRLIEPYNPTSDGIESALRVSITYSGRMHYEMAMRESVYMGQMALRTPVRDPNVSDAIREFHAHRIGGNSWFDINKTFATYLCGEDAKLVSVPRDVVYEGQADLRKEFALSWRVSPPKLRTA